MRYFIAGNIWMFLLLGIFLLRRTERTTPHRVSILGVGTWLSPPVAYSAVALLELLLGVAFLATGLHSYGKRSKQHVRGSTRDEAGPAE